MASKVVQKRALSLAREGSLWFENIPERFVPPSLP